MARNAQYTKLSYKFQFVKTINTEVIQVNVSLNLMLGIVTFFVIFVGCLAVGLASTVAFFTWHFFLCVSFAFVCFNKYRTVVYGCCCCLLLWLLAPRLIECAAGLTRIAWHLLCACVCVCVTFPRNHITRVFACVCVCWEYSPRGQVWPLWELVKIYQLSAAVHEYGKERGWERGTVT